MTDQLRYNANKPQLSYFYATPGSSIDCPTLEPIVTAITAYLSRETDDFDALVEIVETFIRKTEAVEPSEAYSRVCAYGEAKYVRGNFILGAPVCSYFDSALRHLETLATGHKYDDESQEPHVFHVYWNVVEASMQPRHRDNRLPKRPEYDEPSQVERSRLFATADVGGTTTGLHAVDEVPLGHGCGFEVVRDVEWARAELAAERGVIVVATDDGDDDADIGRAWTFRDGKMVAITKDGAPVVPYDGASSRGPQGSWSGVTFGPFDRDFGEYDVPEPYASGAF